MDIEIKNIIHIFRHFYQFQLIVMGVVLVEIMMVLLLKNCLSMMGILSLIFNGCFINKLMIWIILDVLPFTFVMYKLKNEQNNQNNWQPTYGESLFTGIFMGFDILWLGYFWNDYLFNGLIIAIRLFVPWFLSGCNNCKKK